MKIVVRNGLDIPVRGRPTGRLQPLPPPRQISLNLAPFEEIRFKILVKQGEEVKIGQPLVENKAIPGQFFASPAGGIISDIRRGSKRSLVDIVIDLAEKETFYENGTTNLENSSCEELLSLFMRSGIFPHIRLRPFNLIPDPKLAPRAIFVSAVESRPFMPNYEMQILGNEHYFQIGLKTLAKMTTGKVHLVYYESSSFTPFTDAKDVEKHTACGPHPAGSSSLHIHKIDPIRKVDDYVWSLTALEVVIIGKMILEGRYFTSRIISIAGNGISDAKRGFFFGRQGLSVEALIPNSSDYLGKRLISGDPLTGQSVEPNGFLNFFHNCLSVIPENTKREAFHFFRLGRRKFSATKTYWSGFKTSPKEGYDFTTNQHGEERAFIDSAVYDKVMPLRIPTMHLIKAILAEDFEQAEQLGLLEVVPEDFALSTFICPSKIEMVEIVKRGLHLYSKEIGL